MVMVGDMTENMISVDYKVIVEVLIEIYFKVIAKKNTIFIKSQIAS